MLHDGGSRMDIKSSAPINNKTMIGAMMKKAIPTIF
jgi:hypothetical protein